MRAIVLYASLTGNTRRAAHLIVDEARALGAEAAAYPVDRPDMEALAAADVVFVGTWVDGLVLFGHRPGQAGKLWTMPVIDRKKAAVFVTYAINPGDALTKLGHLVEDRGGELVARRAFNKKKLPEGIADFVARALEPVRA